MVMLLMNDDCKNRDNFQSSTTTTDSEDDRKNADKYESVQDTTTDSDGDRKNADINESVQKTSPDSVVYSKMQTNLNLFNKIQQVLMTIVKCGQI